MISYNLHQLINEATNFTEHSQSLIHLILTNNPPFITYTEDGPTLTGLTGFHCRTYYIFSCKKHTWVNYDDLRRALQSVQWDTLIIENHVNQSVTIVARTILHIAMLNVPNKAIAIRTKDCPWITNDITCAIRKTNHHRTRVKRSKSVLDWEHFRHIRNECTSKIRNAQIAYYDKLSEKLHDDSTSTKDWWNIAKQISNFNNKK
jgi:hypothetical protein